MNIKNLLSLLLLSAAFAVPTMAQNSFTQYETECLGVELDGSQTLRSWAFGRNKKDAVEQVKKQAVYDVIFNGIRSNGRGCDMRPLVSEANAKDKYEEYFNIFFTDKGEYLKYVSMKDTKIGSKVKKKNKLGVKYGVTVRVLRSELKKRLKDDGILQ